jgi:hypothetical protein
VSAHRLDEYLQAAQISIDPERVVVDLYLTPGIEIFPRVMAAIDRDGDGAASSEEQAQYVRDILPALTLSVDGTTYPLTLVFHQYADERLLREGLGAIHLEAVATPPRVTAGSHTVVFENRFAPDIGVYVANAMLPREPGISIRSQTRDALQQRIEIAYDFEPPTGGGSGIVMWLVVGVAVVLALRWYPRWAART